jgi:hypothetical protein
MEEDETLYWDYSKGLPDDLDEETIALLKLARVHTTAKQIFVSDDEVIKRSEEKSITFAQAKKELYSETKQEREQLVSHTKKLLTPSLSKAAKQKLRIKESGRPKGSKNRERKISKFEFYKKLQQLIKSNDLAGVETTQESAAQSLDLGGARQLRRLLRDYGDKRKWRDIIGEPIPEE